MSYIKLDRKLLSWEWHDEPNMMALWIYILLRAGYEDTRWHGKKIEQGSFVTSINTLSKETGLTRQCVRTCLDRLEKSQEITRKITHSYTQIYVVKYSYYQLEGGSSNTLNNKQVTHKQHSTNTQLTPIKEIKEIEEKEEYISSDELKKMQNELLEMFGKA